MYQYPYQYPMQYPAQYPAQYRPRTVQSAAEIQAQEVPTDGSLALFPQQDGTCVWGKRWAQDGTIQTIRYVPEKVEETESLERKLDRIIEMLSHE